MRISALLAFAFLIVSCSASARPLILLDGTWDFATDPQDIGESERWFVPGNKFPGMPLEGYAAHARCRIRVPGCWDNQGYGRATDKLKHSFVGKGWYSRNVAIPESWSGKHIVLVIGGVHRYAKAWINGRYLGEHIGYLSEFEFDVTSFVRIGGENNVTIQVDSKQRWDCDTLTGCADLIDYMHISWGGIWGHVHVEARNDACLKDLFVQTKISPPGCTVSASVAGNSSTIEKVRLEIRDAGGSIVYHVTEPFQVSDEGENLLKISCGMPGAKLWSPDQPYLYTVSVKLIKEGVAVDGKDVRFGIREITIKGPHFFLNGKRLFLRGYGDDHIYPEHMALPVDRALHEKRLRCIKSYGFNHVRHHSAIMPPEYYDACDEVGILVSAEFPIAYQNFYARAKGKALDTYRKEWTSVIVRHRNHPCILNWCMGNELWDGVPLAAEFRNIAARLDPERPFVDSDGLWTQYGRGDGDRDTLDFYFTLFGRGEQDFPLDDPGKYTFDRPKKPVVSHETGNFLTFPRLDQIELFKHNIKPFWLKPVREQLKKNNLIHEAGLWALNSERLYLLCHKINTEAIRRNPHLSGYHWWLFQDYWTTSNGIVDCYFRPKSILPGDVLPFNNDVVLLLDGLDLAYRSGESIRVTLLISNYSFDSFKNASLTLSVTADDRTISRKHSGTISVQQGDLKEVISLSEASPVVKEPERITISATLTEGTRSYQNQWTAWTFPAESGPRTPDAPLFVDRRYMKALSRFNPEPIVHGLKQESPAVYVTDMIDSSLCDALEKGACLILLNNPWILPATPVRFKTAWWYGSERDSNAGTVVYSNPITEKLAPQGWCEAVWYPLIEGAQGYLLKEPFDKVQVLIRGIEVLHLARSKALLFQARVGKGTLIVSGLNHRKAVKTPQGDWLLGKLIRYGSTFPDLPAKLPASFLRDKTVALPKKPFAPGFEKVKEKGEVARWYTYREDDVPTYACRQTRPGFTVSWETGQLPESFKGENATFVFAGGLGWISEPETRGFVFLVNGKEVLHFDVTMAPEKWKSKDGAVTLYFMPKRLLPLDAVGFFYVTIPGELLKPDRTCTFSVRSLGSGSKRWFALHPYRDILK